MKPKKIKEKPPIHSELCGNCYYNEEGVCNKNAEKCIYNIVPMKEEDEEE